MRISDWSSDVCSSDLGLERAIAVPQVDPDVEAIERGKVDVVVAIDVKGDQHGDAPGRTRNILADEMAGSCSFDNVDSFAIAEHDFEQTVFIQIGRAPGRERMRPYV